MKEEGFGAIAPLKPFFLNIKRNGGFSYKLRLYKLCALQTILIPQTVSLLPENNNQ